MISLSRLNRIRAIDSANNTIVIEAGCVLQALQEAAAQAGRLFPLSLAAEGSCQIGGNLSTNAGGVHVMRYGNMRELALGLEVVLPNGEIWNGLRGLRKDNSGYDLKQLFIGAEGTLGIITAAVLKLFPLPQSVATAWMAIDSPPAAVRLLGELQEAFGAGLNACELVSDTALGLVLKHMPGAQAPLAESPWHLLVEISGEGGDSSLHATLEAFLEKALERGVISDAVLAQSSDQARRLYTSGVKRTRTGESGVSRLRLRAAISRSQFVPPVSMSATVVMPL